MATLLSSQAQEKSNQEVSTNHTSQSSSKKMAKCYQADQQVKYLHLQAEVDVLWQELQALKQQKEIIAKQSLSTK